MSTDETSDQPSAGETQPSNPPVNDPRAEVNPQFVENAAEPPQTTSDPRNSVNPQQIFGIDSPTDGNESA